MKSALLCLLFRGKYVSVSSSTWDYDNQDEWADTYSMCNNNDESPIDILTNYVVNDDEVCTKEFEWDLDYNHTTFRLVNNGHSLYLQAVEEGTSGTYEDIEGNKYRSVSTNNDTIAIFPNYFQWTPDHEWFCLDSFHFHWGTSDLYGSEHYVDGGAFPLEVHFVHYSCDHSTLNMTLSNFATEEEVTVKEEEGEDVHQLGVVGIFFDVVNESNPAFDAIFDGHLDNVEYPDKQDYTEIVTGLYLADLIPADIETAGYYAYEGSLTTPPCTDIVRWHVMNARGTIGVGQMDKFRQLLSDANDSNIAPNYRELQDNVNTVYACMEGEAQPHEEESEGSNTADLLVGIYGVVIILIMGMFGAICCWRSKRRQRAGGDNIKPMVASAPSAASAPTGTGEHDEHH